MQPKLTYQIVGVSVLKFEFEGGTHYVRFCILFLCIRNSSNLLWLIDNTSFEFFRLTLLAQIILCGPWEQISSTNMHIHGSNKCAECLFIMSIKLVLFRIITNALLNLYINLIIFVLIVCILFFQFVFPRAVYVKV